jgi:hypothetical protein
MTTNSSPGIAPVLRAGALAGVAAGVVNVVIFLIGKAADVPFKVEIGDTTSEVVLAQPLISSFLSLLVGAVGLWLLSKIGPGVTVWTALVVVIFVLDTIYALVVASATSTGVVLSLMHVVVVAAAFVMLRPVARRG